jgi:hypothetical protein
MDLITSAGRLIGVFAPGEQPTFAEANDGLMVLAQMIDAWNADRLTIFTTFSQDFPFAMGQQAYTFGPGGNFDAQRPARIDAMSSILLSNPANPIEVPIPIWTVEQWQQQLPVKTVDSSFPLGCYDDGGFPLRTLNFWPIPIAQNSVRIYSWQAVGSPNSLNSKLSYPQGYAEALRYNLALRLAAEFAAPISPPVGAIAVESLARIKTMNAPSLALKSDLVADQAGYNWKADMFGIPF